MQGSEMAKSMVFGVDVTGKIVEWNDAVAQVTEVSREQATGTDLSKYLKFADDECGSLFEVSLEQIFHDAMQGLELCDRKYSLLTASGRRVNISLDSSPCRDANGYVIGALAVGQDITQQKQRMEENVALAIQNFVDAANVLIFGMNNDGILDEWNLKLTEVTSFSRSDALGRNFLQEFISLDHQATVKEVVEGALDGRESSNFEFPLHTKEGIRVDVLLNTTTRRDANGSINGMIGVGLDISERKLYMEKARVVQELQFFINTANTPIFGVNAQGLVNEWNNRAAQITGFSRDEVLGKDLVEVHIAADLRASVRRVLDNAVQGQGTADFEFSLYSKDRKRVVMVLNATPRTDVAGRIVGMLGVCQDITERKQVEMEKSRVAQELQTFIDTANAPIFGTDAHGLVNEWNNKSAAITGFSREEVVGKDLVQFFITQEYQMTVQKVVDNALIGIETANFEFPLDTKDHQRVYILLNATTRRDLNGTVVGMIGVGQDITERKQIDKDKTRVAQELQTFIDTANAPIFGIDAQGRVNEWNNKAAEITGFPRDEVLGKDLVEVYISADFRTSVRHVLANALQGQVTANFEFPLYSKDHRRVEVLLNATPRTDVAGRIVGMLGVGQDITERKQVEKEKQRVAQELQTFIDTANAPIFSIDANGLVNEWNNMSTVITGFSKEDMRGNSVVEMLVAVEHKKIFRDVVDNGMQGHETANFEFSMQTKDGRRVEVLLNVTPRTDIFGRIVGVLCVGQDLTERKNLEMEKTRAARELQTIVDTANALIFGVDLNGLVNEWSSKSAAVTGYSNDEVLGKDFIRDFIIPECRGRVGKVLEDALQGFETTEFQFPLYTKDNRRLHVLLNATTRRDINGAVIGVIGVGQDITERKRVEMEKMRLAQELQIFMDTANAPIFGIDAEGLVNEWNNKAAEITGFSRDEVLGKNLVEVYISADFRTSVRQVLANALQGQGTANFEFPLYTKGHMRVEVLLNATPRTDVEGRIVGMLGVGQDITERKQVEMEKNRVAQELQTFIDTANAPIFGIDSDGLVNEWNNKIASITGFTRAEAFSQGFVHVFIPVQYHRSVKEVLDNGLQGQETANFEFFLYTKAHRTVQILLNATPRTDVAGRIVGVLGVGQDITERKQVEKEKTRTAEVLQSFVDTANALIFGVGTDGCVSVWNSKSASITGYTPEEAIGKNLVQPSVKEVLDDALIGRETANFEFPFYTKDHLRVDVLLNATARRDAQGAIVGMIGVGLDITERKQAETEKSRVAEELQTFIDKANAPIFGINAQGVVNEWNDKVAEITNFSREEVMGKCLVELLTSADWRQSLQLVVDNALEGQGTANFEFPLYTKDKRRKQILLNATPRTDVSGQIVGMLGVGQDITDRKLLEMEKTRVAQEMWTFIDTANAPIFGIDAQGLVNEWNNKVAAITGFSRAEALGNHFLKRLISEEHQRSVQEVLDKALQGQETANFEFPMLSKESQRIDFLLNATTRRDVQGFVIGVIGVCLDITDKKQGETERAQVVQQLQTFIATANAPIFGVDHQGLVNEWNSQIVSITGYSRVEMVGKDLVKVLCPEDSGHTVKEVLRNALQGRETSKFECTVQTKERKRVVMLLNATPRTDGSGRIIGMLGVAQDITERKQVEMEKLRVAQELQTFIDTANAPIFGIDAVGLVNEWNNKSAAITGFSREEVLGKNLVEDFITIDCQERVKTVLDNALMGVETANFEFPLYTKDRLRVDVLLNATTRRDVNGLVVGMIGVGQDITEKRHVEMEKARVAQELQTFIDTANAPIFGIDAQGRVNEWNNKAAEITGFPRDEVLGKDLVNVYISADFRASVQHVLDNALQGQGTANFEFPLYSKDHRRVEVLLNATPRTDVAGRIVGMLGVGQDITERKQVEIEKSRVAYEMQTFIDTANAPIFGIDVEGLVNEWNNKSAAITGFSREEAIGKNLVASFVPVEYQSMVKQALDNAMLGLETANFESPLRTKAGKRVEVLLNATIRRDVGGRVMGVIGVGQDITEKKQAEVEKSRVAHELQTFIDTANAPIFGIDARGLVNEWNNKSASITGFSRGEVLGKDFVQEFITMEFQGSVKEVLDNALNGLETANFEFSLYSKDRQRVEILLNATTRRDVSGAMVGMIGVGQDITLRKQVEMEKTRVAQELQKFIDTANAPIFGIDAKGLVSEWNNKAAEITGFSRDEVLGKDLVEVYISADFRASVRHVLDNALQGQGTANFEFPLYTKDHRRVEVLLNATPRTDVAGRIVGMVGVGQDITERKRVEMEKSRVAQELQTFIDTANAPIFGIDAHGLVNEWNNKSAAITGFSREEALGKDMVKDFITLDYQAKVKEVLDKALRGSETANFEFPLYTKQHLRVDVLFNATTRRDVSGAVIGMIGVGQDITGHKQVEGEKTRVAQELQTFIDTANAPIFGIDAHGLVNEWNNKSASITGFLRDEVLGKNLVEHFITLEYQQIVKEVLDNALKGQGTANFEFPLYTKNRKRVDVLLNATTRRDVNGVVVGMIGVGQDITERKQVEMEKSRVAQELQTFIDTANAPIFGIDVHGLVNEWNYKAAEITGFSRHEVLGKDLVEVYISADFRTSVRHVLDNALQGQVTANFEFPLFTRDHRRVEVLLNATPRTDVSGKIVGMLGVGQDITERKRVEMEKTQVAQELQSIIDTANAPIFGINAHGRVNEWNNRSAAITGFSREEALGKDFVEDFVTVEYQLSVKEVLDNALIGVETANFEFSLYTKDRQRVDVLLNATTRRDLSGGVVGMIGIGQDITGRKRVEVEKTLVAQELQTFINTANAPIFGIDAHGLVNEWNNKSAAITGFSREEVLGKNLVKDFIMLEFQQSVKVVLDNALLGLETANFEFSLYTKDRQRVDVLLNATTRRDVSGAVVGMIGVGQDITERNKVEMEKTRVAQELQTFIDTANAPIFGIDAQGLINEWNNKSGELTGFSKEEVMGKDLVEVYITEEFRTSVRKVFDDALQGIEKSNFEFSLFTNEQRRVEVLLNATSRRDVKGAIVGVIGVGQDITGMRRLIEQESLLCHLQSANDAKSQFLATMSHEMRTPLNVIMGMNMLLVDTILTEEQDKFSQQIKSSSESLLLLINDILDLTKIESGKLELTTVEFDLRSVVEDAVDSLAVRAMSKGLELVCFLDPRAETTVLGDPDRLRQILLNLLSNAVKFTEHGQVYVAVDVDERSETHTTFRFKIFDSGIGISPEGHKKLFNRFSQVDSSTTRTYGGTGLGLAISKQFAELMNGAIGVQSSQGKGSQFWFTAVFSASVCPHPRYAPVSQLGLAVLIVAEHEHVSNNLFRYCETFGFCTVCALDMEQGAAACLSHVFDAVICSLPLYRQGSLDARIQGDRSMHKQLGDLAALVELYPTMRPIVLCPITQVGVAGPLWKELHGPSSGVLSHPVRLADLHRVLVINRSSAGSEDVAVALFKGGSASGNANATLEGMSASHHANQMSEEGAVALFEDDSCLLPIACQPVHPQACCSAIGDVSAALAVREPSLDLHSHTTVDADSGARKHRILVVDDDSGQRRCLSALLSAAGYEVDQGEHGGEAVSKTGRVLYDALVIDGFMPLKTGWEATREIRAREAAAAVVLKLVVVGVTASAEPQILKKFFDCGATDVITKPITRASILGVLAACGVAVPAAPALPDMPVAADVAGAASPVTSRVDANEGVRHVLVLTDASSRTMLRAFLRSYQGFPGGLEVHVAVDTTSALQLTAQQRFDIVFVDVDLAAAAAAPGRGALVDDISSRAGEAGGGKTLVVGIGATTAAGLGGFNAVLGKPLSKDSVHSALAAWIDARLLPPLVQPTARPLRAVRAPVKLSGIQILIVEDHKGNQAVLEAMLRRLGHGSQIAENGAEAVDLTAAQPFDLILMDCNMPVLDGWQATEAIRRRRKLNATTPIVAVTANALKGDRDKCLAAGMDDYISKPVDSKLLAECIAKWTSGAAAVAAAAAAAAAAQTQTGQRGPGLQGVRLADGAGDDYSSL